ncbi:DUF58 domain-containing protein [Rhodovulum sp. DZ06]|uniref:DUF58 domain-containing protein n=1 Tax=Rhodovulum sp. DZ06 TaxID=3425126 RepID=UPI003D34A473
MSDASSSSPAGARRTDADTPAWLRRDAERISGALPPLLAEAERLAASVAAGVHGRRRAGPGESFWQYRQAMPGDPATAIDWRRSGRSDHMFIREMEWEAAQTVAIWADLSRGMNWKSDMAPRTKRQRAALLSMALSVLLVRGGERVSLLSTDAEAPRSGETQLTRIALALAEEGGRMTAAMTEDDFGAPPRAPMVRGGKAVFFSDFMGPREDALAALRNASDRGVQGAFVQIVDPAEEAFPFDGRLVLTSAGGSVDFETHRARGLREMYKKKLAERRDELSDACRAAGWRFEIHRTNESPRKALLWLYGAIGGGMR